MVGSMPGRLPPDLIPVCQQVQDAPEPTAKGAA
jgi:hypothetical protein